MRTAAKILLIPLLGGALVLGWGYWYSLNHASLHLRVDDYALKSPNRAYDVPHDVRLVLRDASNGRLAVARSVEPLGYILAVHPNSDIGNCEHRQGSPGGYPACYKRYSAWSATWAHLVRSADVTVGSCEASFDAVCSYYAVIHIPREQHAGVLEGFARVLRSGGLALLCLGAADLPAWTEQYHDAPMYWSHYDAATSLSLVEAARLSVVWYRWVAEGSGGHLFVLAQRHDV